MQPAHNSFQRLHAIALAGALLCLLGLLTTATAAARKIAQIETSGGIRAWLVEERSIPLVSLRFTFEGGALQDPEGREGLTSMLASLLTEGAGALTAEDYARRVADEGSQISLSVGRDQIHGGLDALTKRFDASAELLRLALAEPRLDASTIERVRQQKLADLELAASEPRGVAFNRWYATSFPGQRYGRPAEGTEASVQAITAADLHAQQRRLLARDGLRVVIVGDIGREQAALILDRIFGGLPAKADLMPLQAPRLQVLPAPVVVEKELPLATTAFGAAAVPGTHPDFPAWQVLAHIIGSGDFDATLMEEIRVKRGLAYAVSISLINDRAAPILLGGMATKNENMAAALAVLKDVLARTAAAGPSADRVEAAKRYLTGSYLLDFDTNAKLAGSLLRIWIEGRGPDFIAERNLTISRVTTADVKRVARSALAWDGFNVTIVGKPQLAK